MGEESGDIEFRCTYERKVSQCDTEWEWFRVLGRHVVVQPHSHKVHQHHGSVISLQLQRFSPPPARTVRRLSCTLAMAGSSGSCQPLTTSRISRLLRPLRTKCIALATLHPTPCTAVPPGSTYGSKACSAESRSLDILPPPDSLRSFIDHRSLANLRVALYAVRDCFREIITKTAPKGTEAPATVHRVRRLADICATIVGENMQTGEDLAVDGEDSEQITEIDDLYEVVPIQYRRSALLAHALSIILCCPHHVTLLSILLDVSLQHDLYYETCILLRCLLRAAVSPVTGPGSVVRLCHSAHSNYLVDLFQRWKGAGHPDSVFVRLLTEALVEAARSDVWCCRALGKFTRELHSQDLPSVLYMAGELAGSISDIQTEQTCGSAKRRRRGLVGDETATLTEELNRWLNYCSPCFPSNSEVLSSIFALLERCREAGLHRNSDSLAATIVYWATHCLCDAANFPDAGGRASIVSLLKDVSPTVSMYDLLIEKILETERNLRPNLRDCRNTLQLYASCLRAEGLLILEASLWACALRCVETSVSLSGHSGTRKEIQTYQEELMDLVDDAEDRCFGNQPHSGATTGCSRNPRWKWEEIPGCWVECRLPPPKKAKLRPRPKRRSSGHLVVKHPHRVVTTSSTATRPTASNSGDIRDDTHNGDEPNSFERSFKSLVSSVLSRRTILHGSEPSVSHRLTMTPRGQKECDLPASDDALDLFACRELPHVS
ncbi:hypothetical protein B0H10DRAFT_1957866 [Mycena sp. CBHHK59/15]|nr:hypothetical protein B0H10DRAFT_1957866 [Mycena sp. CBHHK59/15]